MTEPGPRVAAWLGTISDLLGEHLYEMPHDVILGQLEQTFGVTAVAHNWSDPHGRQKMITRPTDALRSVADLEEWTRGDWRGDNPLVRWYLATGDPRPWTIGRVPTTLVPVRDRIEIERSLRGHQLEQQLAITYRLCGRAYRAYVLGRSASDFTDEDVVVARHIQRALIGLDRQITIVRQLAQVGGPAIDVGLTGREASVLGLIAAGHSTRVVSRRLGCSPRTVDKHLERIFRKLGVRDRLNAVRVARLWGLVPDLAGASSTSGSPAEDP